MIEFKPINHENYLECAFLKLNDEQKDYVAPNWQSLLESYFEEGLYTRAIYNDENLVGFVLYDYDSNIPGWSMSRFMIAKQYQKMGIGYSATLEFLKYIKNHLKIDELYISVSQENRVAYKLYKKIGFEDIKKVQYRFNNKDFYEIQMKINL